mgnify:CR=1 FL=1
MPKKNSNYSASQKLKSIIFSSQGLPLIFMFAFIGVLFVLFRMKGIELDYKVGSLNEKIERVKIHNKELKAKKAKLLSVKKLEVMADKHNMAQPEEKQIMVVP